MKSNLLQLNAVKTEVLWCASARRLYQVPDVPLRVGEDNVTPVDVVRDLGIYIDSGVTLRARILKTVSSCFAILRQI